MSDKPIKPLFIDGEPVSRQAIRKTERELWRHESRCQRLATITEEIPLLWERIPHLMEESSGPADGMPRGGTVSNPTAAKVEKDEALRERAIRLQREKEILHLQINTVNAVMGNLAPDKLQLIQALYLPPENQRKTITQLAEEVHRDERDLYRLKNRALLDFALVILGEEEVSGKSVKNESISGQEMNESA
jgi:hypothetical protein